MQDAYKRLMNTDKAFKNFRALDILKSSEKWQEHSHALSLRTREAVANGQLTNPKGTRMPPVGQGKMKVCSCIPPLQPGLAFARFFVWVPVCVARLSRGLHGCTQSTRRLNTLPPAALFSPPH